MNSRRPPSFPLRPAEAAEREERIRVQEAEARARAEGEAKLKEEQMRLDAQVKMEHPQPTADRRRQSRPRLQLHPSGRAAAVPCSPAKPHCQLRQHELDAAGYAGRSAQN